jgi:hypothetical protein
MLFSDKLAAITQTQTRQDSLVLRGEQSRRLDCRLDCCRKLRPKETKLALSLLSPWSILHGDDVLDGGFLSSTRGFSGGVYPLSCSPCQT